MGAGIEIPFHEAIVFDLDSAGTDRFLEQHPSGIFFIGEQFADGFPIPSGPASRGKNTLFFQGCHQQDTVQMSGALFWPLQDSPSELIVYP